MVNKLSEWLIRGNGYKMQLHSLWNVLSVPVELLYITSALWAVTAAISKSRPSSLCASTQASKIQSDSSVTSVLHLSLCRARSEKCHDSPVYGFSSPYPSLPCSWCVISTMINAFWPKTSTRAPDLDLQVSTCEEEVAILVWFQYSSRQAKCIYVYLF